MNIDIIDIDTVDATTCKIDGFVFAKSDCIVSAYESKHAQITAGDQTFIASIGSAVNGRRPDTQEALLFAINALLSPAPAASFAKKYAGPYSREVAYTDVPLQETAEAVEYEFGPSAQAQAWTEYGTLGTPYLNFRTTALSDANLSRVRLVSAIGAKNRFDVQLEVMLAPRIGNSSDWWAIGGAFEFMTDATQLTWTYVLNTVNEATILVDGKKLADSDVGGKVANAVTSGSNLPQWITLTFPTRKARLITCVGHVRDLFVDSGASIWLPPIERPNMIGFGDSFARRISATDEPQSNEALRRTVCIAGRLLGYNVISLGGGGIGFLSDGSGTGTYRTMLQYVINNGANNIVMSSAVPAEVVWFFGSTNDSTLFVSGGAAAYEAEIVTTLRLARAQYPAAKIVVSTVNSAYIAAATANTMSASIINAVRSFADTNTVVVPVNAEHAEDQPLFSGTGSVASPAGNGNADLYFSTASQGASDRHPNTLGVEYAGRWFADKFSAILTR